MKKAAQKEVKKVLLKYRTICKFNKSEVSWLKEIRGGADDDNALSLIKDCTITKPGKP